MTAIEERIAEIEERYREEHSRSYICDEEMADIRFLARLAKRLREQRDERINTIHYQRGGDVHTRINNKDFDIELSDAEALAYAEKGEE